MFILPIVGFSVIAVGNYASSRIGFSNFVTGDKDILFPFTTTAFLFFSLLIYLPEAHGKITSIQSDVANLKKQLQVEEEEEEFPIAFLFSLLSISLAVFMDKFCLNKSEQLKSEDQRKLNNPNGIESSDHLNQEVDKTEVTALKYFLSIGIGLINIFSSFCVTVERKDSTIWSELFTFFLFSFILNFSYGFLLAWSQIEQKLAKNLFLFVNSGFLMGVISGILLQELSAIVVLPCISIGLFIYTAVFICLPKIFSNGQKRAQDKFRFWAIFTALLLTLIYYPILYLLKI